MTYFVCFVLIYIILYFLSFDGLIAFPTENDLEANSKDSPETYASDHWYRDIDWLDHSRYPL